MELFKTDMGSWSYAAEGVLRIGAVPLFSGFMYAAVGSYMVRVYRLFDLGFTRYPRRWLTAIVAVGDLRELLHAPLAGGICAGCCCSPSSCSGRAR